MLRRFVTATLSLSVLWSIVVPIQPLQAQDIVALLEKGEDSLGWGSNNGAEFPGAKVTLRIDPAEARSGTDALLLEGDFAAGGNYVQAQRNVETDIKTLSMWIKFPGRETLTMRFVDSTDRCHQLNLRINKTDDWQRVVVPLDQFFAKMGTPDAYKDVTRYETWGGEKGKEGWTGPAKHIAVVMNTGGDRSTPARLWLNDVQITTGSAKSATAGAAAYKNDFEAVTSPDGWETTGTVTIDTTDAFQGKHAILLTKKEANSTEQVSARGPAFDAAPGPWEVKIATKTDLTSMDSSYNATASLEALDNSGAVIRSISLSEQFRQNNWRPTAKQLELPDKTAKARFAFRINKETPGRYWIDDLSATPLQIVKKDDRIKRMMFTGSELGNLLHPESPRQFTVNILASKSLPESQRKMSAVIKDYWGAEQSEPITFTLERKGNIDDLLSYEGVLDLSQAQLAVGRYYEIHGEVAREGDEPFKNYTSFAILPEAAANAFKPEEIPFTSRNWDNRIEAYVRLTHRLGVRICGVWGKVSPDMKTEAPQLKLVQELGMGWLTGSPAHTVEQRGKGWEAWQNEETLRAAMRKFVADFGHVRPMIINLGNEPHDKGDAVKIPIEAYRVIYDEVKKIDPSIMVVGTSIGTVEDWFKHGMGKHLDAYDFHIYEDAIGVRRALEVNYPKMFEKYGNPKPIWSTELGLNSQGLARQTVASEVHKKFANFFAGGGANVSWFGLLYPDKDGSQHDSFGSAHNVFDSRYNKYAPKLDAIAYYNFVNAMLDKKYVTDKVYDGNTRGFLFRNAKGQAMQVWYKEKGRQDAFIPLPGVKDVKVVRIDGSIRELDAAGEGITLTINEDPLLITFEGGSETLADALGEPKIALVAAPEAAVRSEAMPISIKATGEVSLFAQPFWKIEQQASKEDGVTTFDVTSPAETTVRDVDLIATLAGPNGKPTGEIYVRPTVTGTVTISLLPVPASEGKTPAVKVVLKNNGATAQDIAWDVALTGEQSLKDGGFEEPVSPQAYFTDSPSGVVNVAGRSGTEIILPLTGADLYKVYKVRATAKDNSGRIIVDERPVAGFVGVPKSASAPKLDGVLDEVGWKRSAVQRLDRVEQFYAFGKENKQDWTGPEDLSADIRFTWDDDYLYVGVVVTDDVAGPVKPEYAVWQQDGIQFLVDPQRTQSRKVGKSDYGIGDRRDGTTRAECYLSAVGDVQMGLIPDIKIATTHGEKGNITYEIAIPWKNVAPFKPAVGANLGLTMIFNEDDGNGRDSFMTWFGNAHNKDIDKVGDLILMD